MKRRQAIIGGACGALLLAATAAAAITAFDPARLPLGDGKVASSAKVGYVYSCQTSFNGAGAFTNGPWIRSDGTWDSTAKYTVDGSVTWPSRLQITTSGQSRVVAGNDLPTHGTGVYPVAASDDAAQVDRNPNSIRAQTLSITLPLEPKVASRPTCVPGGAIGVMVTGSVLFNALDAAGKDAVAHEVQDSCGGHPERTGVYHYHALPACLKVADEAGGHSGLVGYAFDGFGIYGPKGESGKVLTDANLDACHGHTHVVTFNGKRVSIYHYHATAEYPYTIGCFKGTPQRSSLSGGGQGGPPQGAPPPRP